jgi:poly(A) polymerase
VALPVKGQDLLDLGVPPGPEVGRLLAEIERWWEEGDYRATREDCLSKARALLAANRIGGE